MSTLVCVVIFAAVGLLIGFLGSRLFSGVNLGISLILGVIGSIGIAWVASLLGLGSGLLTFSWWGLIMGILGSCLVVAIYGFIAKRAAH